MRVLLANPLFTKKVGPKHERYFIRSGSRWPHSGVKRSGTLPHYLPFPFTLAYAAAWLQREGFDVDVADCIAADRSVAWLLEFAARINPDVFFFESTTPTIGNDLELIEELKATLPGLRVVLGGTHATVFHRQLITDNPMIDFILRNEFDRSLVDLVACLDDGGDLREVQGITWRHDCEVLVNGDAAAVDPLDELPPPARDLFPTSDDPKPTVYWDGFCQNRPLIQMHATRGCPYTCDFCVWIQVMFRSGRYRVFPPERIVEEMFEAVTRYGAREIYFDDDDFVVSEKHVRSICEEIKDRGLHVKWSVMGDAINLTEDLVDLMAEAGCIGLKFGVESGSPRMIEALGKPVDLKKVHQVAWWCAKNRIKTHATFSIGMYGDDLKSIRETLDYMTGLDVDSIQVSVCVPFPGTRFHDKLKKDGWIEEENWQAFDGKVSGMLQYTDLDSGTVERLRQRASRRWLFNRLRSGRWVWRQVGYFFRVVRGVGPRFVFDQIRAFLVDERLLGRGEG